MILMGQTERSGVRFEVLASREADLMKLLSLSSSETSGLLLCLPGLVSRRSPLLPCHPKLK